MLTIGLGFGGNDFFDVSVIVGAGGNLVVQQVGNDGTRKGDPLFMQNLNKAWVAASEATRNGLKNCVRVRNGRVVRIDACKDHPRLEEFVRTFADGKVYIGIGSWDGKAGNPADDRNVSSRRLLEWQHLGCLGQSSANNASQSSAAQGSKDITVTYTDDGHHEPSLLTNNFMAM